MFTQFRTHYPTGSLISELLLVERETYIVRALVQVGGVTLASGMAGASSIEQAEDQARARAIAVLGMMLDSPVPTQAQTPVSQIADSGNLPITSVTTGTQSSSFDRQSTLKSVDADASAYVTGNSTSNSADDLLEANAEDTDTTGDTADAEIWSASYEPQSSQADEMSDEIAQTSPPSFDYLEVSDKITDELEQLGWDLDKERNYLDRIYGQQERSLLHDEQLLEFLHYLQAYSQTTLELKRLDWTEKQGREYLELTYNQRSRVLLNCQQLQEFLDYLKSQPQPNQGLF